MQPIVPCLWFDTSAEEAVNLYTSLFADSSIEKTARYNKESAQVSGQREGAVMTIVFRLAGQDFMALNGGPYYKFSPAISLFVNCASADEVDALWAGLLPGGTVMMDLMAYPFSPKFGWLQDKFGVSWQINLGARTQKINPFLMFVNANHGKASEAMDFYVAHFDNASVETRQLWGAGSPEPEGALKQGIFSLDGYEFRAMESAMNHAFAFTGAISFIVYCDSQHDIDRHWDFLSGNGGKESMCGWLEDRYGVGWQIVPAALGKWMEDPKRAGDVMKAMLPMRKLDMEKLEQAAR